MGYWLLAMGKNTCDSRLDSSLVSLTLKPEYRSVVSSQKPIANSPIAHEALHLFPRDAGGKLVHRRSTVRQRSPAFDIRRPMAVYHDRISRGCHLRRVS